MLPVLRKGSQGDAVAAWQNFLLGQGFDPKGVDGDFGPGTLKATKEFQAKYKLDVDGVVGDQSYGQAAKLGFAITQDDSPDESTVNFPPPPPFAALGHDERAALFGTFDFVHRPVPDNYENVVIRGTWEADNIVTVEVPQLAGVKGAGAKGRARIHQKTRAQFLDLWAAWGAKRLLDRVLTWEGAFNARFMRGAATPGNLQNPRKLSNHSWGTAFDVNYQWNKLGQVPALVGQKGSVRELVTIANDHGFFWGGHFKSRFDGMHFEVAQLR